LNLARDSKNDGSKGATFDLAGQSKRLSCSIMVAHPTDMALIIMVSGTDAIFLDINAHLPEVVPSIGIPTAMQQAQAFEGVFNVKRNEEILIIIDRSSGSYTVYNQRTRQPIATRTAIDVILGPRNRYADLKLIAPRKGKDTPKTRNFTAAVYEDSAMIKEVSVCPPKDCTIPLRMVSIGEFFAVIVGSGRFDLVFNMQKVGKTTSLVYKWSTLEPIALQFDGAAMLEFEPPYLAIASPNGYAIFDTEHEMQEKVHRQKRVIHFKLYHAKLYLLTTDGLEVDNMKTVGLVSARFSHLLTVDKNAPVIPINSVMIHEVQDRAVTVVDTRGITTTIGIPEAQDDAATS
jgi:hypothetical protein